MFCNKCGNQIPDGSLYCEYCGAKQMNTGVQQQQPTQPVQTSQPTQAAYNQPNQAAAPSGNKSNKGLIIGLSIGGGVLLIGVIILLILLLKKKPEVEEVTEATTEVTTEATTEEVATVSEATPEEPEPEVVPYAIENELNLVGMSYTNKQKIVSLLYDDEGNYVDNTHYSVNETTRMIAFKNLTVSEPDSDGMVTYTLQLQTDLYADIDKMRDDLHLSHSFGFYSSNLVDYYTGYVFAFPNSVIGLADDEKEIKEYTFNDGEKDITFKVCCMFLSDSNYDTWDSEEFDDHLNYKGGYRRKHIIRITVPKDYDGLMFSPVVADVNENEYKASEGIIESATPLDAKASDDNGLKRVDEVLNKKDSRVFLKLSDNAVPETDELIASMYNSEGNENYYDDYDWTEKYYNDPSFVGTPITSPKLINGRWRAYMIWDKDNALDCYGEELLNIEIGSEGEGIYATLDHHERKDGMEGDWYSIDDQPDETYPGTMDANGAITFDAESAGMNFSIQGFYTDGNVMYGIGTMTVQSGESATIFLERP